MTTHSSAFPRRSERARNAALSSTRKHFKEPTMKHFMIKYRFANGRVAEWDRDIGRFIAALNEDPVLMGKMIYRCLKKRDDDNYYHLATARVGHAFKRFHWRDS